MAETKPGTGFLGWLGRQVGHVKKAVKADVTKQVVHREERVEEAKLPEQPNVRALGAFVADRRRADPEGFPELSLTIVKLLGELRLPVRAHHLDCAGVQADHPRAAPAPRSLTGTGVRAARTAAASTATSCPSPRVSAA